MKREFPGSKKKYIRYNYRFNVATNFLNFGLLKTCFISD